MMSFIGFGKFAADAIQNERRVEQLEKERISSELSSLRAQVNPHFLFNALNTVFGLARRQDAQTADAVIRLSDILRYGLYECEREEPTLEREVYFLRQYVEFARLRMHDKECISLVTDIQNAEYVRIAPMLLTPFVENAIKHGVYDNEAGCGIEVSLQIKDNELNFTCINRHTHAADAGMQPSGIYNGIGNKNVKRRLELLYPDRYRLNISNANERFIVELNIQLQ
jgi:LytS/YehU family sensor histidine kinase